MANKDLKNRTPISNTVDTTLLIKLKQLSKYMCIPIYKLLDKAITLLLNSYKNRG